MYYEIIARFDRRKMKSHGYVTNSLSDDIGGSERASERARVKKKVKTVLEEKEDE